jgi:SAM-dependent methyltransferase
LDILHIDDSNPDATLVGDLTKPNALPSDTFDCIICTHVLHMVTDVRPAMAELRRMLKPAGVLLVAVPSVSMCGLQYNELWRFTPEGLSLLLSEAFGATNVTVRGFGNSLAAAAEIRGLVAAELTTDELDLIDPHFPVEVCGRAIKQ